MQPLAVNIEEAGRLTSLSKHTVRLYIRRGLLDAVHVGRRILVPVVSLQRLIESGVPRQGGRQNAGRPARDKKSA